MVVIANPSFTVCASREELGQNQSQGSDQISEGGHLHDKPWSDIALRGR